MNINEWLKNAETQLKKAGIATARLDALVLAEDELNKDKSYLLSHPEQQLSRASLKKLDTQLKRRFNHEPLSYIRGKSEFYGREFIVSKHTLEPRPESETMIEVLKNMPKPSAILDIGTGSGCLAITAKLELGDPKVYASDISSKCLAIARTNSKNLGAQVLFYKGDLLAPLPKKLLSSPLLITANLPYVPNKYSLNKAAKHEPRIAVFGGPDGLDIYRRLFTQFNNLSSQIAKDLQFECTILTESLPFQHKELAKIANSSGFVLEKTDDFVQVFKNQARLQG